MHLKEPIDALGHGFEGGAYRYDETQHWKECSRCGAADTKADHSGGTANCKEQAVCNQPYGDLGPHNWTAATCTEPKTRSVCRATEGTALGRSWGRCTVTTPATETSAGVETSTCARAGCSHTQTRAIPKLPARHTASAARWIIRTAIPSRA